MDLSFASAAAAVRWAADKPYAPLLFLAIAFAVGTVKPTFLVPMSAGALFGFWEGAFLTMLGINLADWAGYEAGKHVHRGTLGRRLRGLAARARGAVRGAGFWTLFSLRVAGFPPSLVTNVACGALGVPLGRFFAATLLGTAPWCVVLVWSADRLWRTASARGDAALKEEVWALLWPFLAAGATLLALSHLVPRLLRARAASGREPGRM